MEASEPDNAAPLAEAAETSTEARQSQSMLLAAGRLEEHLASKPEQISTSPSDIVAWSINNLLAIADSPSAIKFVHLSSSHRTQTIAIQEKPYLLTFSPRGDALFAAFRGSGTCCLWTRYNAALNDWKLKQTWADWQGRVLDLQWLAAPMEWASKAELYRRPAKGPQFAAGREMNAVGAVVICESGQVVMFSGSIEEETGLETQTRSIPISSQEKIAKVAIGLVPNESMALVAYTLRKSSKAALPGPGAEGDALGMFFEGADEVVALDQQQDSCHFEDGQDKVEMMELRLDLAASPSAIMIRSLCPLYLSSYESPLLPLARSLTQLLWIDADDKGSTDVAATDMKLFAAFYADNATTLRLWELHREEVEALSEAFAKLEAAKSKVVDEEKEDWIPKSSSHQTYADYIGDSYQTTPAKNRIVCSWTYSPVVETLSSVSKPRMEYRVFDAATLQLLEGTALPTLQSKLCLPAISPSGVLGAQVIKGKVVIVQASKEIRWSPDDAAIAYWPAMVEGRDITDLVRVIPCDLESISATMKLKESPNREAVVRMVKLGAQSSQAGTSLRAKNNRMLLELIDCFRKLNGSDKGPFFDQSHLWTLMSVLEWLVWLLETLARQAYLENATSSVSSPPTHNNNVEIKPNEDDEAADLLALTSHTFVRLLLTQCIIKAVKFCNWLHRMNQSKEQVKELMNNAKFRETLKIANPAPQTSSGNGPWSLADNLRLAQMKVNEIMLKSAIDLSQFGRLLKLYKDDEGDKNKSTAASEWWAHLHTGNREKIAKAIVESSSIRMALSLFCPSEEEGHVSGTRDILTKARLNAKARHFICLSCQGKTHLPLRIDQRCVCGSGAWWNVV